MYPGQQRASITRIIPREESLTEACSARESPENLGGDFTSTESRTKHC